MRSKRKVIVILLLWTAVMGTESLVLGEEGTPVGPPRAPIGSRDLSSLAAIVKNANCMEDLFSPDTLTVIAPGDRPLGPVRSIHRGSDGALLIVTGGADKRVYRFDPVSSKLIQIGAPGEGPGEYRWPVTAATTSRGDIVLLDMGLLRVTVYNKTGTFLNSFVVPLRSTMPHVQLIVDHRDRIVIHSTLAYKRQGNTAWVFDKKGKLLFAFGTPSEQYRAVIRRLNLPSPPPTLVCLEASYFAVDYVSYRIRKYDESGRFLTQFGEKPGCYRSLARADLRELPSGWRALTPSIKRKLDRFRREQLNPSSGTQHLQVLFGRFLLQWIRYAEPCGKTTRLGFMVYDANGRLLSRDLQFRNPPSSEPGIERYLRAGNPEGIYVLEYRESSPLALRVICLVRPRRLP